MRGAIFFALLTIIAGSAAGRLPTPSADAGRFIVERVITDPALDSIQARYHTNDPRFMGRLVEITSRRLSFDEGVCTQSKRRWTREPIPTHLKANLDSRSLTRNHLVFRPMNVPGALTGAVPIVSYACLAPDGNPRQLWSGVSSFPLAGGRRGLLWEGEVVLVLIPEARAAPAQPSFDCKRATTPATKAICADPILARWDRSVAAAYALLLDGGGPDDIAPIDDGNALVASQRTWITTRDRCGTDKRCLTDRMAERTDALMRRQL